MASTIRPAKAQARSCRDGCIKIQFFMRRQVVVWEGDRSLWCKPCDEKYCGECGNFCAKRLFESILVKGEQCVVCKVCQERRQLHLENKLSLYSRLKLWKLERQGGCVGYGTIEHPKHCQTFPFHFKECLVLENWETHREEYHLDHYDPRSRKRMYVMCKLSFAGMYAEFTNPGNRLLCSVCHTIKTGRGNEYAIRKNKVDSAVNVDSNEEADTISDREQDSGVDKASCDSDEDYEQESVTSEEEKGYYDYVPDEEEGDRTVKCATDEEVVVYGVNKGMTVKVLNDLSETTDEPDNDLEMDSDDELGNLLSMEQKTFDNFVDDYASLEGGTHRV